MRYIRKSQTSPKILVDYIETQTNAGLTSNYEDFQDKEDLNKLLREEQGLICCYCQQRIDHFQGNPEGGSHNEHMIPQNGPNGNSDLDLDYYNLYACCNYSQGREYSMQHCGQHKDYHLIHNFLRDPNCRSFFKYSISGEIIPQGNYNTQEEYLANRNKLSADQVRSLDTIITLNLNQGPLKELRKRAIIEMIKLSQTFSSAQARGKIQRDNFSNSLAPFVEVVIYYLNKFINEKLLK